MFEIFTTIDNWLFYQINTVLTHPALDVFFVWITDLHKTTYFKFIAIPLLLWLFIRQFKREGVTLFLFLLLTLGLNDYSGSRLKHLVKRERPENNISLEQTQRSPASGYGFPSNHSSNMFAFATFTSQFLPQIRIPLFVLAATIGYSRIYNGVHYPSDVFGGSIIGMLWGLLMARLAKQLLNYFRNRKRAE